MKMKHFIIVKFKEDVNKQDLIAPINKLFKETLKIEGVFDVILHISNSTLPNRYDIMIEMILSETGLKNFDKSEIHLNWKKDYGSFILNKAIFDCEA